MSTGDRPDALKETTHSTEGYEPNFAPADPTDGRSSPWEWRSRWPREARVHMRNEAVYLVGVLVVSLLLAFGLRLAPTLDVPAWLGPGWSPFCKYLLAIAGGAFGGALLSAKWLYHVAAKGGWHEDRFLWRLLTPVVSAGIAFSILLMLSSGLIVFIDQSKLSTPSTVLAVSVLVGAFSDSAVAKMSEIAQTLFGVSERH